MACMGDGLQSRSRRILVAVLVAAAMSGLDLPPAVHAAHDKLPVVSEIEVEVHRLQLQIEAKRTELDSLLGLRAAVPESLTDHVQEEIEVLQDRVEVEFERLNQIHESTHEDAETSEPPMPRPPSR